MERISANCLKGEAAPDDLVRLWEIQLAGSPIEPREFEIRLVDAPPDEILAQYGDIEEVGESGVSAYMRMLNQIRIVATHGEAVAGYWVGEDGRSLDTAPIVEIDGEGQFRLGGATLSEYLITLPYDATTYGEVRTWLVENGVIAHAPTIEEISSNLEAFDDPDRLFEEYESMAELES